MKKLPIGIQTIEKIVKEGYVYVDKTEYARQLIEDGYPHYFMSRPRRFGKSLFLDTLRAIFAGDKQLFIGCAIYQSSFNWESYPVLMFDFSLIANRTAAEFEASLKRTVQEMAETYGLTIKAPTIQEGLMALITQLHTKKNSRVVVLVDEYDKPIIDNLNDLEVAQKNRDLMKDFYSALKGLDRYLKFTFVTGISKFSQVSLFSGPNNLVDITMDPKYSTMMGYTEQELKTQFSQHLNSIVKEKKFKSVDGVLTEIREWYNGYRFCDGNLSIYNPFSTLNFLRLKTFSNYWYSSGTPSFLIEEIRKRPQGVTQLRDVEVSKTQLADISKLDKISLPALMFQTGYLTLQSYNPEYDSFRLDFPNREVRQAFFDSLIQEFAEINPLEVSKTAAAVRKDLDDHNIGSFVAKMNTHFAKIPYLLFPRTKEAQAKEGFYQAILFTFLEKSGIPTKSEEMTSMGRIDLVLELPHTIYIFELKLDKSPSQAISQAEAKQYKKKYSDLGKQIAIIGINFSSEDRNISAWSGALFAPDGSWSRDL